MLFFWQSLKYGAWQWFWASIVIWLAAAWFSAELLPRVMGVTHAANLYLAHAYILPASVFFWVNHVQKQPDAQEYRSTAGPILTYFAQSLLAMHCALALTAVTTYAIFPDGFSVYVAAALGAFYMQPALWWGMTLWLMAMAALAHWAWNTGAIVADYRIERAGICLAGCFYRVGFETALPSIFIKRPMEKPPLKFQGRFF